MSTKEEIMAAAKLRFAKKEITISEGSDATVTVNELSRAQWDQLQAAIWVVGEDGKPISVNEAGEPDPNGASYKYLEGRAEIVNELRLHAMMTPQLSVEELKEWPNSLKRQLLVEAMALNGIIIDKEIKDAAGK